MALNEGTYAYLEDLGIPRDRVQDHLEGLVAKRTAAEAAFYSAIPGGKEGFEAALAWGRETYTDAQREAFNAARDKGGQEAADAVEALMARFARANPNVLPKTDPAGRTLRDRRRASPNRVVAAAPGGEGGGSAAKGYANEAEYHADLKAAAKDPKKLEETRVRLRASAFFRNAARPTK